MRIGLVTFLTVACGFSAAAEQIAPTLAPERAPAEIARVETIAKEMSQELSSLCPAADAGDQLAYDSCRLRLSDGSKFRARLVDFVLWGRQRDANMTLKESTLTQFGPDVFTTMYIPLFMFDGKYKVSYLEGEKLYRVELGASFRNRLSPGQFPYPFWHEKDKWATYENANSVIAYIDPNTDKVRVVQFTRNGSVSAMRPHEDVTHAAFDGQWLWTDAKGKTQPQVTVFDGVFSAENPHTKTVESTYKQFALSLRSGACMNCHVPNNPDKMKRLVLLQTPAHAAAEIDRTIKSVEKDRMPLNEFGIEEPLKDETKKVLLERARAFSASVAEARDWENKNRDQIATSSVSKK